MNQPQVSKHASTIRLRSFSVESDGSHESFSASDEDQTEDEVFTTPKFIDQSSLGGTSQCMHANITSLKYK